MTRQLVVGFDANEPLLRLPDVTLQRGETVAILGANGSGKTTLLRTITGELPPLQGAFRFGAGCRIGYLEQARTALHEEEIMLEALLAAKHMTISAARDELGRFGFSGDDVFRAVATLSGGERSRFALALLAQTAANCWLLDEPTNHLDIASQDHLQRALERFAGTTLLVSHDRYLIAALATQIWEVVNGEVCVFTGRYAEFAAAQKTKNVPNSRKAATEKAPHRRIAPRPDAMPEPALTAFQRQKRREELEALIHQLECQQAELETRIASASSEGAVGRVRELGETYAEQAAIARAGPAGMAGNQRMKPPESFADREEPQGHPRVG